MNLAHLVARLETLRLGKKGVSLFLHMMPLSATEAILLRSPLAGTKIDYHLPGFYHGEFQVIVRSGDYDAGAATIARVIKALTFEGEEQVGPQLFRYCRPQTMPVAFPLSTGGLIEHTVQFDACFNE